MLCYNITYKQKGLKMEFSTKEYNLTKKKNQVLLKLSFQKMCVVQKHLKN